MRTSLLVKVLRARRQLRRRESWSAARVAAHQEQALRELREFASTASPFYRQHHQGLAGAPLRELPVMTKSLLMDHWDAVVTADDVRLADVQSFLARMQGAERFRGRYYVAATAGTTGQPGVFVWDADEWARILASYSRPYGWGGPGFSLMRRTKMAVVSSTTPWHQSALVGATVDSRFIPTLRLDSGRPLAELASALEAFQPDVLVGYASILGLLAAEARQERLHLSPTAVFSASEVLTEAARRGIAAAWGEAPFNVYAATETAGIAAECEHRTGLHLFEDCVVTEVVDEENRPVPPGEYGAKVLVTALGARTVPLIRYELTDSVRVSPNGPCPCGRPFPQLDGVQGREQEALRMPGRVMPEVTVQPVVLHRVMDTVPASAWQVVQEPDGLTILVAGLADDFPPDVLTGRLRQELDRLTVADAVVRLQRVGSIPRTTLGKAPLIRALRAGAWGGDPAGPDIHP